MASSREMLRLEQSNRGARKCEEEKDEGGLAADGYIFHDLLR